MVPENDSKQTAGKRRDVPEILSVRYAHPWPVNHSIRSAMLKDWRYIAKQIISRNGASFRLLTAIDELLDWETGEVWASDLEIAEEAGRCATKTISRDVAAYRKLGIIVTAPGWQMKGLKNVKARVIRLAIPMIMPDDIHIRDLR